MSQQVPEPKAKAAKESARALCVTCVCVCLKYILPPIGGYQEDEAIQEDIDNTAKRRKFGPAVAKHMFPNDASAAGDNFTGENDSEEGVVRHSELKY